MVIKQPKKMVRGSSLKQFSDLALVLEGLDGLTDEDLQLDI
jgi:hypothetical protein